MMTFFYLISVSWFVSFVELIDKEHLIKQRQLLNKRLGLDMANALGIETDSIFNDDDLTQTKPESSFIDKDKVSNFLFW